MVKNSTLLILVLFLFFIVNALSVSAEDDKCVQLFNTNCAECHELDRGCELLGQSKQEWEELFEFMEGMGADIDQQPLLIDCLNKPDEGVKASCKK